MMKSQTAAVQPQMKAVAKNMAGSSGEGFQRRNIEKSPDWKRMPNTEERKNAFP